MLPTSEIDTLTMIVTDAIGLALESNVADGYTALMAGLQRAEESAEEGVWWGPELVARWRLACENYVKRYRVKKQ
jgi:hypothetical protein